MVNSQVEQSNPLDALVNLIADKVAERLPKHEEYEQLTVKETASKWNVSENTVREAVKTGQLKSVSFGTAIRIVLPIVQEKQGEK